MRSKFEKRVGASLTARGVDFKYETDTYNYFLTVRGECGDCGSNNVENQHWYTPDFFLPNGIIVETKGKLTVRDRKLAIAVRELHPDLDLRFCFMRDNKISRTSKTRYSDWASKNGFKYSIGDIPDQWIEETHEIQD